MTPKYNDWLLRILMSVLAAHVILINYNPKNTLELITGKYYAYSMLGSVAIAFAAISLVRYISKQLDKNYRWENDLITRLCLQLFFGVILAMLIVVILVTIYFGIRGYWILDTYWFKANFLPEVLMLFVLNFYFLFYYLFVCRDRIFVKTTDAVSSQEFDAPTDSEMPMETKLHYGRPITDLVYAISTKEHSEAVFKDGKVLPWKLGIKKGMEKLPNGEYMDANRSELIRTDNILSTEYMNIEKTQIRALLYIPEEKVVEFSRERTSIHRATLKGFLGKH